MDSKNKRLLAPPPQTVPHEFLFPSPRSEIHRVQSEDQMSLLSIKTLSSTSSRSLWHGSDNDSISSARFSISTINSSISDTSHFSAPSMSELPRHDPKAGIWNDALRVIPCGEPHSLWKWDVHQSCNVCGFTQWHALMLHAPSMGIGSFVAAMTQLRDIEKVDFAGNYPVHFLCSGRVMMDYFSNLLQFSANFQQNVFGQNPLHVLNPQSLREALIPLLEWFIYQERPTGLLLTQRDIYCHTPLHCLLQYPLERSLYQKVLKVFPFVEHQIRSLDTSGRNVTEIMQEASLKIKSKSPTDYAKIQAGIIEIRQFLSESEDAQQRYQLQNIARGVRGLNYFGFYQCHVCGQTNTHSDSYLDLIKCACDSGPDRNCPDELGETPAHALICHPRCNSDPEHTVETASQTALLFRVLIPPKDPTILEALHALDPRGKSLVHNIAVRGFDEILEYVLGLETPDRRPAMVNSCYRRANGTEESVLQAVIKRFRCTIYEFKLSQQSSRRDRRDLLDEISRLKRCKDILINAGAQSKPDVTTRFRIGRGTQTEVISLAGSVKAGDPKDRETKTDGIKLEKIDDKGTPMAKALIREPLPTVSATHSLAERVRVEAERGGDDMAYNCGIIGRTSDTKSENSANSAGQTVKIKSSMRLFPIDASKDEDLISAWKDTALPLIQSLICGQKDSSISISLLRRGETLDNSHPIVRIQTSEPRSEDQQAEINAVISSLLLPVPVLSVLFVTGSVRRTAKRSDLDVAPCAARNTEFLPRPPMGVSIGVGSSIRDTATLGGYIYVDDDPYILTVHHLFTDDETGIEYGPGTAITQPSLQEAREFGEVWNQIKSSGEPFHLNCVKALFEKVRACLPAVSFATLTHSSGFRNRCCQDGHSSVEMDWAICKVELNRKGSNVTPCDNHWCKDTSPIVPGGTVFAVGRTSGHQTGIINGCTTTLVQRDEEGVSRESEEWAIIRSPTMTESSWASGGIGTYGDSGSWILETGTDNVLGQLWGRDYQQGEDEADGDIITYFAPIHDIFDDIRELTGAKRVSLCTSKDSKQLGAPDEHSIASGVIRHVTYPPSPSKDRCRICNLGVPTGDAEKSLVELENEINLLKALVEDMKIQLLLGSSKLNTPGSLTPSNSPASTPVSTLP